MRRISGIDLETLALCELYECPCDATEEDQRCRWKIKGGEYGTRVNKGRSSPFYKGCGVDLWEDGGDCFGGFCPWEEEIIPEP